MTGLRSAEGAIGPVLQATALGWAIVAAISMENERTDVCDEGAYLRVLVPDVCRVSRAEVERQYGQPVSFPGDLELAMPSFSGRVRMTENGAAWWRSSQPEPEVPS